VVESDNQAFNAIRLVQPEFTPVDKKMPTSLVEAGNNHQSPSMSAFG
jgi:hypothetical protein